MSETEAHAMVWRPATCQTAAKLNGDTTLRLIPFAFAGISLIAIALAEAPPAPATAEAAWKAEIEAGNQAYARKPTAILKIDDAIYLKPGQTAWLISGTEAYAWSLEMPASARPSVTFSNDSKTAEFKDISGSVDLLEDGKSLHEISPTARVSGGIAQIEPGKDGLRVAVYNDDNPEAAAFKGLEYYGYDPAYAIEAAFQPAASLEPKIFQTSRGWYKQFFHAGDAVFTLQGKSVRLPLYAGTDKLAELDSLSAFIMDDTTGSETYGVGRYVDMKVTPGALPATVSIDFNNLYNPNCARSEHYNCPVAVDRLPLAVRAGEKKPSAARHAAN